MDKRKVNEQTLTFLRWLWKGTVFVIPFFAIPLMLLGILYGFQHREEAVINSGQMWGIMMILLANTYLSMYLVGMKFKEVNT